MELSLTGILDDKDALMAHAMADKTVHPKKNPTLEVALKATAKSIKTLVIEILVVQALPRMQDVFDTYELINGEYADVAEGDEDNYSQGLDDEVEKKIEPYEDKLSADWLGINTIDTRLWEDKAVSKLVTKLAKELYKQLTFELTPAKIMSAAGVVATDVEAALSQHMLNFNQGGATVSGEITLEDLLAKIKNQVGKDYDVMSVYSDIEAVLDDDDEILCNSAGSRIGLDPKDVEALQIFGLEYDTDEMSDMLAASKAPAKKAKRKPAAPKTDASDTEGAVSPEVLLALKECGGVKDTAMAEELGVSRSTYTNWCKGKTAFVPDEEQYLLVRTKTIECANRLNGSLALLDGTEPVVVG